MAEVVKPFLYIKDSLAYSHLGGISRVPHMSRISWLSYSQLWDVLLRLTRQHKANTTDHLSGVMFHYIGTSRKNKKVNGLA